MAGYIYIKLKAKTAAGGYVDRREDQTKPPTEIWHVARDDGSGKWYKPQWSQVLMEVPLCRESRGIKSRVRWAQIYSPAGACCADCLKLVNAEIRLAKKSQVRKDTSPIVDASGRQYRRSEVATGRRILGPDGKPVRRSK